MGVQEHPCEQWSNAVLECDHVVPSHCPDMMLLITYSALQTCLITREDITLHAM